MMAKRQRRYLWPAAMSAVLLAGGCGAPSEGAEAGEPSTTATAATLKTAAPPSPRVAEPQDYLSPDSRYPQWGFVTPSSDWICVIGSYPSNGDRAACAANPHQGPLPIPDLPLVRPTVGVGNAQTPNVVSIHESADPGFELLTESLWDAGGVPRALPEGAVLRAGGFSCNAEKSMVSCRDDATGKGFSAGTGTHRFF